MSKKERIKVTIPDGNGYKTQPTMMVRVQEHIVPLGGFFVTAGRQHRGQPVIDADGSFYVDVMAEEPIEAAHQRFRVMKVLAHHYGFNAVLQ